MELILKEDIKNLGFKDDVVKVRNGYGMNYLLPQGLAVIANASNKKIHAETTRQRAHKVAKLKMDAQTLADTISGFTISIPAKAGENGKLFGSVTSQHLVERLKAMGYTIDKKQIVMPSEHVKQLGSYAADLVLHKDVKGKIQFDVVPAEE